MKSLLVWAAFVFVLCACAAPLWAETLPTRWTPVPNRTLAVNGERARRIELSRVRLEQYTPTVAFEGNAGWPGDKEGRAILGQVLIGEAARRPSRVAAALVRGVATRLNARGYVGPILPEGIQDEQVMSGHGWLLRGLVAYHNVHKDPLSIKLVRSIVDNLLLPAVQAYRAYPVSAANRPKTDLAAGTLVGETIAGWRLSSDIGCAFIMLDGAVDAYQLLGGEPLRLLVEDMIARFRLIDLVGVGAQTHASLTAARAILRFAIQTGNTDLRDAAAEIFKRYRDRAMTEHHANHNWFGRPLWTEGCGIVDSYILAMELFRTTNDAAYLEQAQNIYFNGIGFNQRPNGGFGCDNCPGAKGELDLHPSADVFEAHFCCSMRGAEGMASAHAYAFMRDASGNVLVPDLNEGTASWRRGRGTLSIATRSNYPIAGDFSVRVTAARGQSGEFQFYFAIPSWLEPEQLQATVNGNPVPLRYDNGFAQVALSARIGTTMHLRFPIGLRQQNALPASATQGRMTFRHGPLLLGAQGMRDEPGAGPFHFEALGGASYRDVDRGIELNPITGLAFLPEAVARKRSYRILFAP